MSARAPAEVALLSWWQTLIFMIIFGLLWGVIYITSLPFELYATARRRYPAM